MCGVPFHSADSYIPKLVERGHKVAICEQMEDPAEAKGLVRREVVRITTPGTIDIAGSTENDENIFIASVFATKTQVGIAYGDITTGELACMHLEYRHDLDSLISELVKIAPKEIVYDESSLPENVLAALQDPQVQTYLNPVDSSYYRKALCEKTLMNQFGASSLISLDLDGRTDLVLASGIPASVPGGYSEAANLEQFKHLDIRESSNYMQLDRSTLRNLETCWKRYMTKTRKAPCWCVLGPMLHTAMGGRLLKRFYKRAAEQSGADQCPVGSGGRRSKSPAGAEQSGGGPSGNLRFRTPQVPAWPAAAPTERIWWR